jgi:palmitoyltransferase ZDHHC13/17
VRYTVLPPTNSKLTRGTDFSSISESASDSCNILSPSLCKLVNADAYTLILGCWVTLQLTWVTMLLFVQFVQVSRAMTTYENMFGIQDAALTSAFTSTGTPLDPQHPSLAPQEPAGGQDGHGHAHGHKHKGGWVKQWARLLGVDPFIETVRGRGAATGNKKRRKGNPYSRGCVTNCRDFWCDPQPIFGQRETGAAVLGGDAVNYSEMYESPRQMELGGGGGGARGRRRGGYEAVAGLYRWLALGWLNGVLCYESIGQGGAGGPSSLVVPVSNAVDWRWGANPGSHSGLDWKPWRQECCTWRLLT